MSIEPFDKTHLICITDNDCAFVSYTITAVRVGLLSFYCHALTIVDSVSIQKSPILSGLTKLNEHNLSNRIEYRSSLLKVLNFLVLCHAHLIVK